MEQLRLTVKQLNMYVKSLLEGDINLSAVTLVGELSNFKNHYASGHLYFVLKDNDASIKAVMFKGNALRVNFVPSDGMQVVCRGYVSLYERDGSYQFYAESMIPFGQGDIALEFERVKAKLEAEGLFNKEFKKPLPLFPQKIGVITSESGAALQDILNISARRFPMTEIVVFPALVQGLGAPQSLISALNKAFLREDISLIIIGRGGGSAEDLSCFNDESLARKIFASAVPIISAVGHETDFTICDYVSDLRAPTPSAAAEIALPSLYEVLNKIYILKKQVENQALSIISDNYTKLQMLYNRRCFQKPEQLFVPFQLRLDKALLEFEVNIKAVLKGYEMRLNNAKTKLEAFSYSSTLARGFSVTYKDNNILKTTDGVEVGEKLNVKLFKGRLRCVVEQIEE